MEIELVHDEQREMEEDLPAAILARACFVERRPDGADSSVVARIREFDPGLLLFWDPAVQLVAVFQKLPGRSEPWFIGYDHLGQGVVDLALLRRLMTWQLDRYGGFRGLLEDLKRHQKMAEGEEKRKAWERIDHDKTYHVMQRYLRTLDGMPRDVRMAVPSCYQGPGRSGGLFLPFVPSRERE